MGNAESTLAFKNQFSQLSTRMDLSEKDPIWQLLLNSCVDHHQVFPVLGIAEVRQIRDTNPQNLEILVKTLIMHLNTLVKPSGFGPALQEQVLCYLRALERLIPIIYEKKEYASSIEGFLWTSEGYFCQLIDSILRLSEQPGFTVPLQGSTLWAPGLGAEIVQPPSKDNQYNRQELLRALLVVLSEPLYCLYPHGLSVLVAKPVATIASLFCSLLNAGLQPPSLSLFGKSPDVIALTTSMLLVTHHHQDISNNFRKLLSKIFRESDLRFVEQRTSNPQSIHIASLLWELVQANTKYTPPAADKLVDIILEKRFEKSEDDLVRILTFVLLHLSSNEQWCAANTRTIMRLYTPFNEVTVHIPALLDLLYNVSPFAQMDNEDDISQFHGFAHAIMISKNTKEKQSLAASIRNMLQENKLFIFGIKDLQTDNVWLDQYLNEIRQGNPATAREIQIPPMHNNAQYVSIKINWDNAKLKWYSSVLWGYAMKCAEIYRGLSPWTKTDIQLFKVETYHERPGLRNPKGAVEAIGDMIFGFAKR